MLSAKSRSKHKHTSTDDMALLQLNTNKDNKLKPVMNAFDDLQLVRKNSKMEEGTKLNLQRITTMF